MQEVAHPRRGNCAAHRQTRPGERHLEVPVEQQCGEREAAGIKEHRDHQPVDGSEVDLLRLHGAESDELHLLDPVALTLAGRVEHPQLDLAVGQAQQLDVRLVAGLAIAYVCPRPVGPHTARVGGEAAVPAMDGTEGRAGAVAAESAPRRLPRPSRTASLR
ncbi:hypothetical protein GCM10025880_29890 [Methylorubrum aminovorans]|nr:hypothetical protein GCM10025880_29890 [Methylorubrum aminovorans]